MTSCKRLQNIARCPNLAEWAQILSNLAMAERVTLEQVAAAAGVSSSTASRALNRNEIVHEETARRVQEAARRLHYRPNITARALSGGRSDTLCMVIPNLSRQRLSLAYYASLITGAEETANEHGLHLIVKNKDEMDGVFALLEDHRLAGILLRVGHNMTLEKRIIRRLRKSRFPFVLLGRAESPGQATVIRVDILGGARAMAHHLVDEGARKFLFISGPKNNSDSNDRLFGFRAGLLERGLSEESIVVAQGDYTPGSGYQAALNHLKKHTVDAVFASTDHEALGVISYCSQHGFRIPTDVAVAGYDDHDYSEFTVPSLTTVRQPVYELGKHAVEQLLFVAREQTVRTNEIIIAPELIVRESTRISKGRP